MISRALLLILCAPLAAAAGPLDSRVEKVLASPAQALKSTPRGFRIIALSNFADYCKHATLDGDLSREDGTRCLRKLAEAAMASNVSPIGDPSKLKAFDEHGLYLSHLNIVLGAYEKIAQDGLHKKLNERISKHLARTTIAQKTKHIASFPNNSARWPADQVATLYSIHLYDPELALEPIKQFFAWSDAHGIDAKWSLPKSEVTGKQATSKWPRGCALSFMVRYMAAFAPDRARALWDRYRDVYLVDLGVVVGLREWPPEVEHRADSDSGPIVRGIGVAASGFGIGAAKAAGDDLTYGRLIASAAMVRALSPELEKAGTNALAQAIELAGRQL